MFRASIIFMATAPAAGSSFFLFFFRPSHSYIYIFISSLQGMSLDRGLVGDKMASSTTPNPVNKDFESYIDLLKSDTVWI